MPIILIAFGIMFIDVGIRGNEKQFLAILKEVLLGSNNKVSYFKWAIAIFMIGSLGYIKDLRDIDIALLVLVFLVMLDSNNYLSEFISEFNKIK